MQREKTLAKAAIEFCVLGKPERMARVDPEIDHVDGADRCNRRTRGRVHIVVLHRYSIIKVGVP